MKDTEKRYVLKRAPFLMLIAGLTAVAADAVYIALYSYSLPPDLLAASIDRIARMIEYIFAAIAVLVGGTLLFDYIIKSSDNDD
ncbi:MAG: hypothetical protein IJT91_08620 [Clostridia bacterium]|nr:hypothetical protein [Clostridia bacterium]